jgi:hypothetical protein
MRLASVITSFTDKPLRERPLVQVELEEITGALEGFEAEVAAGTTVGYLGGRLI